MTNQPPAGLDHPLDLVGCRLELVTPSGPCRNGLQLICSTDYGLLWAVGRLEPASSTAPVVEDTAGLRSVVERLAAVTPEPDPVEILVAADTIAGHLDGVLVRLAVATWDEASALLTVASAGCGVTIMGCRPGSPMERPCRAGAPLGGGWEPAEPVVRSVAADECVLLHLGPEPGFTHCPDQLPPRPDQPLIVARYRTEGSARSQSPARFIGCRDGAEAAG